MAGNKGILYIVATPIGNLDDMTFRAVEVLNEVGLIAAEDTRHTKKLLSHYKINTKLISVHEHNETQRIPNIISHLDKSVDIALVSDAGTPLVSDPGYKLVREIAKAGFQVLPIPGCSAAIAGLSVSGLPTDTFLFLGFPPKKKKKRKEALIETSKEKATLIYYESPKRILTLIKDLISSHGDRKACLAREISKVHEEYIRGKLSDILERLNQRQSIKGECSLFVKGDTDPESLSDKEIDQLILKALENKTLKTSGIAKRISQTYGLSKTMVYDRVLKLKNN